MRLFLDRETAMLSKFCSFSHYSWSPEHPSVASDQDAKWNEELKQEEAQANVKPDIGEILSEKPILKVR